MPVQLSAGGWSGLEAAMGVLLQLRCLLAWAVGESLAAHAHTHTIRVSKGALCTPPLPLRSSAARAPHDPGGTRDVERGEQDALCRGRAQRKPVHGILQLVLLPISTARRRCFPPYALC